MSVPDAFRPHLAEWGDPGVFDDGERLPSPGTLVAIGARALVRSIEPEGRERGGAFDLLAADAFVTRAAESALDEDDPRELLARMASRLASGDRGAVDPVAGGTDAPDADATD